MNRATRVMTLITYTCGSQDHTVLCMPMQIQEPLVVYSKPKDLLSIYSIYLEYMDLSEKLYDR